MHQRLMDHYNDPDEDDDAFDDDKLTEEATVLTFEDPENLGLDDAEDVADDDYLKYTLLYNKEKEMNAVVRIIRINRGSTRRLGYRRI